MNTKSSNKQGNVNISVVDMSNLRVCDSMKQDGESGQMHLKLGCLDIWIKEVDNIDEAGPGERRLTGSC